MLKLLKSFTDAKNGLITAWKEERNFRIDVIAALAVIFCVFYFGFSLIESAIIVVAIVIVLSAEIANTAIEDLCDKVEPMQDPAIGKIKDTMAAFVGLSAMGALVLGIMVFYHHFFAVAV